MIRLILTRLLTGLITLFLTAFFVFFAVQALPGDVAQQLLGQDATPEALELLRAQLGLDQNVWVRFWEWISSAVVGDFGTSLVSGLPVAPQVWQAFGKLGWSDPSCWESGRHPAATPARTPASR